MTTRIIGISIVILGIVAGFTVIWQIRAPSAPVAIEWYYDLNDQIVFSGKPGQLAPLPAPSGDLLGAPAGTPAGVHAVVEFTSEPLPTARLLRTLTPAARAALSQLAVPDPQRSAEETARLRAAITAGSLIQRPGDTAWQVEASPAGKAIFDAYARQRQMGIPTPRKP